MVNYRAARALLGKSRNAGEGAAGLSKSSGRGDPFEFILPGVLCKLKSRLPIARMKLRSEWENRVHVLST
jgi:hypothetical protein